jgi:RNA polymerase sigma factor (sigma-70 family)
MKAADTFDPERGLTFGSFASMAIRYAIDRCGAMAKQLIHVPEEVRLRRRRVLKTAEHLGDGQGHAADVDTVADFLDISTGDVADAFEWELQVCSLDSSSDGATAGVEGLACADAPDVTDELVAREDERLVREQVAELDERKRRLIEARYAAGQQERATFADLGRELGITRERVRQLEASALHQLRTNGSAPRRF